MPPFIFVSAEAVVANSEQGSTKIKQARYRGTEAWEEFAYLQTHNRREPTLQLQAESQRCSVTLSEFIWTASISTLPFLSLKFFEFKNLRPIVTGARDSIARAPIKVAPPQT